MIELMTVILGMMPISEVRGAIPFALFTAKMPLAKAIIFSVLGNFIPVIPILLFLEQTSNFLRKRSKFWDKFFSWLFTRTRKRSEVIEKYEAIGLAIFVGIPLPFTGAWSGCVAAFLFGIKFWRALIAITLGILIATIIVSAVCLGALNLGQLANIIVKRW